MYTIFFKRVIDFFLALSMILVLLPVLLSISIILLLTGEHEVFYLQNRVGKNKKLFKIWKYATMLKKSPGMGTGSITLRDDPRVLPVGKFLRKTKINELPQLVNVLIGNMSFVGARPLMQVDFDKFPSEVREAVYNTSPGITGIGSIIFRDEEKWMSACEGDPHEFDNNVIAPYKGALELWYQQHISFMTDMKILFCTGWVILFSKSELPYKLFKGLPEKPEELMD